MSEPKLISPMLDEFMMGDPLSEHHGVRCCPAMRKDSDSRYIVKIISIPASQVQLDALLLAGAYKDSADAMEYFKTLADDIAEEAEALTKLSKLEGYSLHEVIIIASMIEKESANVEESYTISSVIFNRLKHSSKYPYLNIDAALVYALGKTDITAEDTKIDHPYNTYKYPGLTPGPISNPSQNSIAAALDPEKTDYYFYALDPSTSKHHFSKTYEEHLQFLASLEGQG